MSIYKQAGTDIWSVNISVPGHPRVRRSTGTTDRLEAQRIHDEIKAGLWSAPKLSGKTWGDAVVHWCKLADRSESDLLSLAKFGRNYKDRALQDVTRESIVAALAFCRTPATFNRYRNTIAAILHAAQAEGWLRDVPKLPVRDVQAKPREWITPEQWGKLYVQLPQHQRMMATFAIETGLRQANVLGLTWDRVSIERAVVWIEAPDMKARHALGIPLNDRAIEVLKAELGKHEVWVFTFRGKPIKEIKTAFQAACVRAGVGQTVDGLYQGFTWHGLRHTWATWHLQNGTPRDVLQKLGGWEDERMVQNYAHHSPGYLAQFANNVRKKS